MVRPLSLKLLCVWRSQGNLPPPAKAPPPFLQVATKISATKIKNISPLYRYRYELVEEHKKKTSNNALR